MPDPPEQRAVISGIGISRIGRKTGIPAVELTVEAARAAIADAGLAAADIDGLATFGDTSNAEAAAALGMAPEVGAGDSDFSGVVDNGGLLSPVMSAAVAVGSGRARHVLVHRTVQMMGGAMTQGGGGMSAAAINVLSRDMGDMASLMAYHAYSAANWVAMHARRHMHLYGTTKEQLGWLAVNSRANAALNPRAVLQQPMTLDDYLAARVVSTPLGLFDCDIPVDGSIAFVVSTADAAADLPGPAVRFDAFGGVGATTGGWFGRADFPKMASADAAADLWSRTSLRPADVDVAELYDGFTFLTFAWLEALGLCGEGEAGPFVEGGSRIAIDGELPLNTYGGQLSAGRMHGYWVLHEACVQLRGEGGDRQVPGSPEVAVVANGGGPIAGCLLLTR